MIRVSGVVVFPDGRREAFTGGAREWVAWEQYALSRGLPTAADDPRRAAGMTMTWFLAFRASTRGQKERPAFEAWLDLIDDVVDVEVGGADPTPPEPSRAASSSSLRLPASPLESSPNGTPASSQPSSTF